MRGKLTSGQMIVVMIEAGTTMPPMPRPARTNRPYARYSVSAFKEARDAMPIDCLVVDVGFPERTHQLSSARN